MIIYILDVELTFIFTRNFLKTISNFYRKILENLIQRQFPEDKMNNSKNSYFFWVFYFFSKEFLVIFPAFKQVKIIIVKKMIKK